MLKYLYIFLRETILGFFMALSFIPIWIFSQIALPFGRLFPPWFIDFMINVCMGYANYFERSQEIVDKAYKELRDGQK